MRHLVVPNLGKPLELRIFLYFENELRIYILLSVELRGHATYFESVNGEGLGGKQISDHAHVHDLSHESSRSTSDIALCTWVSRDPPFGEQEKNTKGILIFTQNQTRFALKSTVLKPHLAQGLFRHSICHIHHRESGIGFGIARNEGASCHTEL